MILENKIDIDDIKNKIDKSDDTRKPNGYRMIPVNGWIHLQCETMKLADTATFPQLPEKSELETDALTFLNGLGISHSNTSWQSKNRLKTPVWLFQKKKSPFFLDIQEQKQEKNSLWVYYSYNLSCFKKNILRNYSKYISISFFVCVHKF